MRQFFLILTFLILRLCVGNCQQYRLEKLSSWNFSENASITGIAKDTFGFLWIGTNTGLFRYDGVSFDRFPNVGSQINNLYIDKSEKIWLTSNYGLVKISALRDSVHIVEFNEQFIYLNINSRQEVFGLTKDGNIYAIEDYNHIRRIPIDYSLNTFNRISFDDFEMDERNNFWLRSNKNLFTFNEFGKFVSSIQVPVNTRSRGFKVYDDKVVFLSKDSNNFVEYTISNANVTPYNFSDTLSSVSQDDGHTILIDDSGNYWLSNYGYVIIYHKNDDGVTYLGDLFKEHGWEQSWVDKVLHYQDNEYYLGSSDGLFRLKKIPSKYQTIIKEDIPALNDKKFFSIRKLFYDDGILYIGSYAGFGKFYLTNKLYQVMNFLSPRRQNFKNPLAYDIIKEDSTFLIASESSGYLNFHKGDEYIKQVAPFTHPNFQDTSNLKSVSFFAIHKDKQRVLLGGMDGLEIFEKGVFRKIYTSHDAFNKSQIYDIIEAGKVIYIGSVAGLFTLEENNVQREPLFPDKTAIVNYLYHQNDILWVGTRGEGLIKYNITTDEKQYFHYDQGLIDLTVNAIAHGNDGGLWFSTNLGISRLDTQSNRIEHYFSKDELEWNEFNHNAMTTDDQGNIYFGGTRGIVYFNPKELRVHQHPSRIVISRITKRNGDSGEFHSEIFDRTNQQKITLNHNDRYFSIDFAKSDLSHSQSEQFQYKLDGQDWIRLGNSRTIQFTDLNPGQYNLMIASSDADNSTVTPLSIPVIVHQVYYKQWWALIVYALLILGIIYWIIKNLLIRSKLQAGLSYQTSYNKKLEELAETKTQIFSNLAHEFQTPLTLIQGPAAKIKDTSNENNVRKWSDTILKNSSELMEMIQQMLKLSRMDEGVYEIQWVDGEFVSFIKGISSSFNSIAYSKNITLSIFSNEEEMYCRYDEEKLNHIVKNLLSNALKFTPEGGEIQVRLMADYIEIEDVYNVEITIEDSGIGIEEEHIPHIFDRFYQADGSKTRKVGGNGIGLSLVKEFTQLLNGQISVESNTEKGTRFMLSFEFEKVAPFDRPIEVNGSDHEEYEMSAASHKSDSDQNREVVLIIEDNLEVREFMVECLQERYEIYQAYDGVMGYDKAVELIPDLIISDVMMPRMDGYTLLQKIKENPLTLHIPCVMLTAKNSDEDRIQGRKSGAEAFLGKPFLPEELEITVDNLLALRRNAVKENSHASINKPKDPFIQDLLTLLENELDNSDLNVKMITSEMATSRTQLHRKIKSLTGKSINQFIREYRLEKARALLKTNQFHVSEVCYKVGFSQPSYFSARYKEHFGVLPSEVLV